jgi:signal transduction histidine kinase
MLNPKNDSVDDFLLKMKEVAARLLPDIRYTFRAPGEKLLDRVSIDFKRNIFLIYKESLNNIVRHSSATEVAIEVKQGHDMFTMHIHDNGRGFDINQTVSGSGLANLRRRAELMGGKLDITSDTGKGTSITLAVKNHANA